MENSKTGTQKARYDHTETSLQSQRTTAGLGNRATHEQGQGSGHQWNKEKRDVAGSKAGQVFSLRRKQRPDHPLDSLL
jgi:hypothetical protein